MPSKLKSVNVVEAFCLKLVGYDINPSYNRYRFRIRICHYAMIAVLFLYAILTTIDIFSCGSINLRPFSLWILSSGSVISSLYYRKNVGYDKVVKHNNHLKNRKKYYSSKSVKLLVFKDEIYNRQLTLYWIVMIPTFIFALLLLLFPVNHFCVVAVQFFLALQTVLNCFELCVSQMADFYQVQDSYKEVT